MVLNGTLPDGSREQAQSEWGIPGEYPRERAVSVFVGGHLYAERLRARQLSEYLGYEQLERE